MLLPLIAMQFTAEVRWDVADFVIFGTMLVAAGSAYELAARATVDRAYRAAVGVGLATAFLLVWTNLAVGIVGAETDPTNLIYGGVLACGMVGALMARGRPTGMAQALVATALAQLVTAPVAVIAGWSSTALSSLGEVLALNACFAALWLLSAWLFRKAARAEDATDATP